MTRYYMDIDGQIRSEWDDEIVDGYPIFGTYGRRPRRRAAPPPPPPVPTEEQQRQFFQSRIDLTDNHAGIRLGSIQDVLSAVNVFAGGAPLAMSHTANQIGDAHGGMAVGMFLLAGLYSDTTSWVKRLLERIEAQLTAGEPFRGDWDYDGPGPFHKCGINIGPIEGGAFRFSAYAAYVGAEVETRLMDKLTRLYQEDPSRFTAEPKRGYRGTKIVLRFAPSKGKNRFRIPIHSLCKKLDAAMDRIGIASKASRANDDEIMGLVTPIDGYYSSGCTPMRAYEGEKLVVSITMPTYYYEPNYVLRAQPDRDGEFRVKKGILSGPARFNTEFKLWESVEIDVHVFPAGGEVYEDQQEDFICEVARQVHQDLQKLIRMK